MRDFLEADYGMLTFESKLEVDVPNQIIELKHRFYSEVIRIKESQIREGLIKLGWTPPKEET